MSTQEVPASRPGIPVDTFGLRLRIARAHADDISIEEAAQRCGLKPATWSTWERGVHSPPHREAVAAIIASRLGIDEEWLLNGGPLAPTPEPNGGPGDAVPLQSVKTGAVKRATHRNKAYCSTSRPQSVTMDERAA